MSFYEELLNDINNLRKDVALFRKVLLHVHSPDSNCYKEQKSKPLFIEALKSSELDMIGITDHMKCSFACQISEDLTSNDFCVLPGMEISLRSPAPWNKFKLHILAIFPEKFDHEQISKILPPNTKSEKYRTGEEEINDMDISSFIKNVHDNCGICIAAHIDSDRGVRCTFRELGENGIIQFDISPNNS